MESLYLQDIPAEVLKQQWPEHASQFGLIEPCIRYLFLHGPLADISQQSTSLENYKGRESK